MSNRRLTPGGVAIDKASSLMRSSPMAIISPIKTSLFWDECRGNWWVDQEEGANWLILQIFGAEDGSDGSWI